MPEGPEVELVRRGLMTLCGRRVNRISLTPLSQKYPKYAGKQAEFDSFTGQILMNIQRRGKYLLWIFEEGAVLNHLGMSGKWLCMGCLDENPEITHPKVLVEMIEPPHAVFDDVRNFGQFKKFPDLASLLNHKPIRSLGVDSLEDPFPMDSYLEKLGIPRLANKPIGEVLLDQRIIAGIGNIYKSESLFEAGIDPMRSVAHLTSAEKEILGKAITKVTNKALKYGGSTFGSQAYMQPNMQTGEAQKWHVVYAREGEPCERCNTPIKKQVQKDRSTFYCPSCQK
ncbi:MAG: bifunctional DNA-formamidopyrimidine glycosylase/DNA-(apurinic or apyrimidinic site) lyase [Candidatus Hermodarchaeota archaeon]